MAIVTLLTDFGIQDEYVGVMKGVILSANAQARIVDISHHVPPQDVIQASQLVMATYPYFPRGTVHVVVVDPGVGTRRAIVALKHADQLFLAPDNGLLHPLVQDERTVELHRVANKDLFLKPVSATFHGRDIFAPVAGWLSMGQSIRALGPPMDPQTLVSLPRTQVDTVGKGALMGRVVGVDHFGNLITNIDETQLDSLCPPEGRSRLRVECGGHIVDRLAATYAGVTKGKTVALIGSRGYLEIAVNCGNAQHVLNIEKGTPVTITCTPPP